MCVYGSVTVFCKRNKKKYIERVVDSVGYVGVESVETGNLNTGLLLHQQVRFLTANVRMKEME